MSRPSVLLLWLEFSLLALRTHKDSRRTRGLKSACLTGPFSANQRKLDKPDVLSELQRHTYSVRAGGWPVASRETSSSAQEQRITRPCPSQPGHLGLGLRSERARIVRNPNRVKGPSISDGDGGLLALDF